MIDCDKFRTHVSFEIIDNKYHRKFKRRCNWDSKNIHINFTLQFYIHLLQVTVFYSSIYINFNSYVLSNFARISHKLEMPEIFFKSSKNCSLQLKILLTP